MWNRSTNGVVFTHTVAAAGTAISLLDDLISVLESFRDAVSFELGQHVAGKYTPE